MRIQRKDNQVFIQVEAYRYEHVVLRAITIMFFLSVMAYGYFVGHTILNMIAYKEALAKMERVKSNVSSLEQEYYALIAQVGPGVGERLGLSQVKNREFVRRVGPVGLSTGDGNEI